MPENERTGRRHASAVTVAVLPDVPWLAIGPLGARNTALAGAP
jgi:hypothetical protein